jgi:superkiller protein 3
MLQALRRSSVRLGARYILLPRFVFTAADEGRFLDILQLPGLYNDVLNHPNTSDELRRQTESKLLRHKQAFLHALPAIGDHSDHKTRLAKEVQELVDGMVLLSIPDELAWLVFLENKNAESIGQAIADWMRDFSLICSDR